MTKFDTLIEQKKKIYIEAYGASAPIGTSPTAGVTQPVPDTASGMGQNKTTQQSNAQQPQQPQQPAQQQPSNPDMNKIKNSIAYLQQFAQHPDVTKMLQAAMKPQQAGSAPAATPITQAAQTTV